MRLRRLEAAIVLLTVGFLVGGEAEVEEAGKAGGRRGVEFAIRAWVMDASGLAGVLPRVKSLPSRRVEPGLELGAPALGSVELVFGEALWLERALGRISGSEVIMGERLEVEEGKRGVRVVGFDRGLEGKEGKDEWFLKIGAQLVRLEANRRAVVWFEAEVRRFGLEEEAISGAGIYRLGVGRTLLAGLELPRVEGSDRVRVLIVCLRPEEILGGGLSSDEEKSETEGRVLTGRVDLSLDEVPLYKALVELREATGGEMSVMVDPGVPKELLEARVSLIAEGIEVGAALERLLKGLGLGYDVEGRVIFISTPDKVPQLVLRVYAQVMQLMFEAENVDAEWEERLPVAFQPKEGEGPTVYRFTPELLMEHIVEQVEPGSWKEKGGEGTIEFSEGLGVLLVRQRPGVHSKIGHLLERLTPSHETETGTAVAAESKDEAD